MWFIVIGIIVLGILAAIAGHLRNKKLQGMLERGEIKEIPSRKRYLKDAADSMKPAKKTACLLL